MKVSELLPLIGPVYGNFHLVETTSDALRVIRNQFDVDAYIATFGDVEIVHDDKKARWCVPQFSEQIEKYTDAKARDCAIWGCE